jgi:hypothetical protein
MQRFLTTAGNNARQELLVTARPRHRTTEVSASIQVQIPTAPISRIPSILQVNRGHSGWINIFEHRNQERWR